MSLDGGFLHIVKTELLEKIPIGARIDKIHQPSRDEIVLTFRTGVNYERLLLSANSMSARVCLTKSTPENPATPPLFCLMLRKKIGNGRLTAITQDGLERVLNFDFTGTDELGDKVNHRLIIEIMGRTSNIILTESVHDKVIDSIKRVTDEMSRTRRILPNLVYEPPQRDLSRHCLLDCDIDSIDWETAINNDKALLKMLEGVSPIFTREAVWYANGSQTRLKGFLHQAKSALLQNDRQAVGGEQVYTVNCQLTHQPKDFCFMPISQYGSEMLVTSADSANELLDDFFKERSGVERLKQRSGNIMKSLNASYERLSRKIEFQKLELAQCKHREHLRIYGDLINANIYKINKDDTVLETENYENGEQVQIELSPRLTPAQNAQKYYSAFRKLSTAEKMLSHLIREGEQELTYLDTVIDSASRAVTDAEIDAIREEIGKSSGKNPQKSKKQSKPKPLKPLKYTASDGTEILVGRNNRQNDELTFKIAKPNDIWLHTKDIAGSHVILRCSGDVGGRGEQSSSSPNMQIITEAAVIAAQNSKARDSSRVPVDYTLSKFVKKPSGSKPGYVIFTNNKTLYVNPTEQYDEGLL